MAVSWDEQFRCRDTNKCSALATGRREMEDEVLQSTGACLGWKGGGLVNLEHLELVRQGVIRTFV